MYFGADCDANSLVTLLSPRRIYLYIQTPLPTMYIKYKAKTPSCADPYTCESLITGNTIKPDLKGELNYPIWNVENRTHDLRNKAPVSCQRQTSLSAKA